MVASTLPGTYSSTTSKLSRWHHPSLQDRKFVLKSIFQDQFQYSKDMFDDLRAFPYIWVADDAVDYGAEEVLEHTWFKEIPEWVGSIDILHDYKASNAPILVLCSHGNAESVSLAIARQGWIVSHLLSIDPDQRWWKMTYGSACLWLSVLLMRYCKACCQYQPATWYSGTRRLQSRESNK